MYEYVSYMNIYHLKYFIDAARLGSVSKSAELNRVSHSAVSQAIKGLEQTFEAKLIYHSKRRFQLTPQGEQCLVEGERILNVVQATRESLQRSSKEVTGSLVIWAPQSLVVDSLYRALDSYRQKYPRVKIKLLPGPASAVRGAIAEGKGHIGMLLDDSFIDQFESASIKKGHFVLVSKKKGQSLEKSGFLVTAESKVEVVHLRKTYKSKFKKELPIEMEVMSWGVIKNLVEKNLGIGYVPDYCVDHELSTGKLHKLNPPGTPFQYTVKAIWAKNRHLHQNAKLFLELLKAEAK